MTNDDFLPELAPDHPIYKNATSFINTQLRSEPRNEVQSQPTQMPILSAELPVESEEYRASDLPPFDTQIRNLKEDIDEVED